MIFATTVQGIPCQCDVLNYSIGRPMRITGTGFGDADPPEPPEFEFNLLDRKGYKANWLEAKMMPDDPERLRDEFEAILLANKYGKDY